MARSEDVVCIGKRLTYEWAPGYIFVGYLLSIVGSYVALVMVKYARQCMIGEQWSAYWQFISAAGIALGGTAIWAMHLIGMKALKLDTCEGHRVRVTYNAALTIGSLLAAIGFVAASMHLVMPKKINAHEKEALEEEGQKLSKFFNTAKKKKNTRNSKVQVALCFGFVIQVEKVDTFQYAFASAFLTIGAMVMHNMGMLAQYGPYTAVHNPYIVVASGVIAAVAAAAGLFIVIQLAAVENATLLFKLRFFAAITIASAVNTLHYVGMTGVHYVYREPTVVGIAAMMVNIMLLIGAQQYSAALVQEIKDASKKARAERVQSVVDELYERLKENEDGENAKYIPQLANVDPSKFGIAMCDVEGKLYVAGDVHFKASIQSVSKPLLYLLAMRERGRASVELKVGEEPSGKPFDQLAIDDQNRAFNPLINTGALTTASMLSGDAATRYTDFEKALKSCCHDPAKISMDDSVYKSEMETNQNNRHILAELVNHGIVDEGDADAALDAYTRACSCDVTALDIAVMAATIANGGDHPVNGKNVISRKHTTQLVTVMMSCGMYNGAGKWIVDVGIPAKSGVSGHLMACVPGVCGIGIFSPRLDVHGNSARGVLVAEALSKKLGLHVLKKSDQAVSSLQSTGSSMDEGEKFQAYDPTPALLANEPRVDDVVEMDADQRRRKFSLSSPSASKIKIYPGPPEDDDEDDDIFREDIA